MLWETKTLGWKLLFFLCGDGFWPLRPKRLKIKGWVIIIKRCRTLWQFQNCFYFLSSLKTVASTKKRDFVYTFVMRLENYQWNITSLTHFQAEHIWPKCFFCTCSCLISVFKVALERYLSLLSESTFILTLALTLHPLRGGYKKLFLLDSHIYLRKEREIMRPLSSSNFSRGTFLYEWLLSKFWL